MKPSDHPLIARPLLLAFITKQPVKFSSRAKDLIPGLRLVHVLLMFLPLLQDFIAFVQQTLGNHGAKIQYRREVLSDADQDLLDAHFDSLLGREPSPPQEKDPPAGEPDAGPDAALPEQPDLQAPVSGRTASDTPVQGGGGQAANLAALLGSGSPVIAEGQRS